MALLMPLFGFLNFCASISFDILVFYEVATIPCWKVEPLHYEIKYSSFIVFSVPDISARLLMIYQPEI